MPGVRVDALLQRAAVLLQDPTYIRWPKSELLDWLNDAQRELVLKKPNACVNNSSLRLTAGTKQSIPADGVQLLHLLRNVPGPAIRIVSQEILDSQNPMWHQLPPQKQVVHYCFSELDPKTFYVYPPNDGTGTVELAYSALPPEAKLDGVIGLDDIYAACLLDYVVYRAYSKDAPFAADDARAQGYYTAFINALGGKAQAEAFASPNAGSAGNPNLIRRPA